MNDKAISKLKGNPILIDRFKFWTCFGRSARVVWHNKWLFLCICTVFYGGSDIYYFFVSNPFEGYFSIEYSENNSNGILAVWLVWSALYEVPPYFASVIADAIIAMIVVNQLRNSTYSPSSIGVQLRTIFVPLFVFCVVDKLVVDISDFLLYLPLIIYGSFFWLTVQSMAVENLGVVSALKRSLELTKGNRLRYACIVIAIIVFWNIKFEVVSFVSEHEWYKQAQFKNLNLCRMIIDGIMGSYIAALMATAYHDLRSSKEFTPDQRAIEAFE